MSELLVVSEVDDDRVVLSYVSRQGRTEVATVDLAAGFHVVAHPSLPVAYLTSGAEGGSVVAVVLSGEGSGTVTRLAEVGGFPCHLALSPDSTCLATANYVGGSVSFIEVVDGRPVRVRSTVELPYETRTDDRQEASHPHTVYWVGSAAVLVPDLGSDRIWRVDAESGGVTAASGCPEASGPRHLAVDRSGRLWTSLELSSEVGLLADAETLTARGTLAEVAGVRNYPGDIVAAGRWIVMANRGADTLAVYDGDATTPALAAEVPAGGAWPAQLAYADGVLAVALRDSDEVAFFDVSESGVVPQSVMACPRPIALAWRP